MDIFPVFFVLICWTLHWYFALFAQSFFHHRYMTHQSFTMTKNWETFFYYFAFFCQGSSYLSVRTYVIMHRLHHAHSDDDQDPHSPKYFKNLLELLWNMKKRYAFLLRYDPDLPEEEIQSLAHRMLNAKSLAWFKSLKRVSPNYLRKLPEQTNFDVFADAWYSRIAWGLAYAIPYVYIGFYISNNNLSDWYWLLCALYPLHFIMGPIHGVIVNWFGHKRGYRNFDNGDDSTNCVLFWDIFLLGELYQNNHHHEAARANFAVKEWEFDPLYPLILLFNRLRIIKLKQKQLPTQS